MDLVLSNNNGISTMTSLQLVEFINHLRKQEGNGTFKELRHDHFLQKVREVLKGGSPNFWDTYKHPQNGQEYPLCVFPKREAMLMAMSYSYDIQAVVYDAWETAEKALLQQSVITLPNFLNPAEAAKAWAVEYEQKVEAQKQLQVAQHEVAAVAPKVVAYDMFMDSSKVYSVLEASKLLEIGERKLFKFLRENKYLSDSNLPYERFTVNGSGLFNVKVSKPYRNIHTGSVDVSRTTEVTTKGIVYLANKLKGTK